MSAVSAVSAVRKAATLDQKIERWANVERVLNAMPEHERQHHWNMATWGEKTDCGTVACAAGHCGLDPWFRERGFQLNFDERGASDISDVPGFFGLDGCNRIFYDSTPRPVETVLGEVRAYLNELRTLEALAVEHQLPPIGTDCPEHGGVFAGLRFDSDRNPYALVVGPEYDGYANWKNANAWAAALNVGDHTDFVLPDRRESIALCDRVKSLFQPSWYWTSEQHESYADYAWCQDFTNGNQNAWHKGYDRRARAVRRILIHQFNHSPIAAAAVQS